jgi:hypothetical protein
MKIERRFKDPGEKWEETTLEECIEHTEGSGYWKKDCVKDMLEAGNMVWTPFAEYRAV